jgi:hypothetical protein
VIAWAGPNDEKKTARRKKGIRNRRMQQFNTKLLKNQILQNPKNSLGGIDKGEECEYT